MITVFTRYVYFEFPKLNHITKGISININKINSEIIILINCITTYFEIKKNVI